MKGVPITWILGATGVAYGWMVKNRYATEYKEAEFDGDEESNEWTFTSDDRSGVRTTGDIHAGYKALAEKYHT